MPRPRASLPALKLDDRLGPLIAPLHSAVDLDAFWRSTLHLLRALVPHHSCSLLYGIVNTHRLNARHHMPGARSERRSVSNLNIVRDFLARHPGIQGYTFAQVLAEDPTAHELQLAQQSRKLEAWNDFVHLAFWDGSRPDAVLSVRRSRTQGPFTRDETALLFSLHPVIEAGLLRLRRLAEERSQHLSIERFLAAIPVAVLFLDAQLKLIYASNEGYAVCAEWNYGQKTARRLNPRRSFTLPAPLAIACEKLHAQPAGAAASPRDRQLRVAHPANPQLVAQLVIDLPRASPWTRPVYRIIFLVEHSIDAVPLSAKPAALALLQRLTAHERRVALLVTEGGNNRVIATRLGKSPRTVECQLTEIYRKLGVKNRVQLTRTLL